ncbi:MAG: FkbM family methyltransferase [Reyranellaceae bacterium]
MQLDPRPFIGRLRWIRDYPAFAESPTRFVARSLMFTLREQASSGETLVFKACGGRTFRTPRNNVSSFIAAVFDERDLNIVRFWRRALPRGSVFFDVGANIGLYSVPASIHLGPSGSVVAFEAHPLLCHFLAENLARNSPGNVAIENVAVGQSSGRVRLAFNARNPGETRVALDDEAGEVVPVVSLDEYSARRGLARVDYIKLDVEGYETMVLRGAADLVRRNPDILLQTEFEPAHRSRYGAAEELAELLLGWGLIPHRIGWRDGKPSRLPSLAGYAGEIIWCRCPLG